MLIHFNKFSVYRRPRSALSRKPDKLEAEVNEVMSFDVAWLEIYSWGIAICERMKSRAPRDCSSRDPAK